MSEENLCVLIDFENIAAGTQRENLGKFNVGLVLDRLKEKGRLLISRAYGDWGRFASFKQKLLEHGVSMMELTAFRGQDKNRADIALVVDAMELAFTREHISTYVLVSGDSDFTPLVMKLREFNKKVIGIGTRGSTSKLLANSCDEFIFYDTLKKDTFVHGGEKLELEDAFTLLQQSLIGLQKDNIGPVIPSRLKQAMQRKIPTFDEGEFGFSGFSRFLRAAADAKRISVKSKGDSILVDVYSTLETDKVDLLERDLRFLSDESKKLYRILVQDGYHPTTHVIRHTVVHEFVDNVLERRKLKKPNTLIYSFGDIERRCRKTVEESFIRSILETLHEAGVLLHPQGGPIRSPKVGFIIKKDAEEMLHSLREYYVQHLLQKGFEISKPSVISELLWNDLTHLEEAETLLEQQVQIFSSYHGQRPSSEKNITSKDVIKKDAEHSEDVSEGDLEELGLAWEEEPSISKHENHKTSVKVDQSLDSSKKEGKKSIKENRKHKKKKTNQSSETIKEQKQEQKQGNIKDIVVPSGSNQTNLVETENKDAKVVETPKKAKTRSRAKKSKQDNEIAEATSDSKIKTPTKSTKKSTETTKTSTTLSTKKTGEHVQTETTSSVPPNDT